MCARSPNNNAMTTLSRTIVCPPGERELITRYTRNFFGACVCVVVCFGANGFLSAPKCTFDVICWLSGVYLIFESK